MGLSEYVGMRTHADRFRWEYTPGSELFVVYTDGLYEEIGAGGEHPAFVILDREGDPQVRCDARHVEVRGPDALAGAD